MSRNVEALVAILNDHAHYKMTNRELSEVLAAHACLAVDSLTDEQDVALSPGRRLSIEEVGDGTARVVVSGDALRAALRRYATGDTE